MRALRWWQFGLLGGFSLTAGTLIKLVNAVHGGAALGAGWGEVAGVAAAVFGMGFVCGLIVWAGRGLYQWLGMAGDAIVGVTVMVTFFVACMLLFEPELLGAKFFSGGAPMLALAVVLGLIFGPWAGRDWRCEFASREK
jgi:hypothetical protein